MAKVLINFSVEEHVALAFKTRVPPRERSSAIEKFMIAMTDVQEIDAEEEELIQDVESLRKDLLTLGNKLSERVAMLEMKRAQNAKFLKEDREKKEAIYDSMMAVNPLRDVS